MKKIIFFLLLAVLLFPSATSAVIELNLNYPAFGDFDLNEDQGLDQIVAWFYFGIIAISGVAAFVMIVWGGIQRMTSAGNPTAINDSNDRIKKAILGLLLILSSFLILQVINPELLSLQLPT